MHPSDPRPWSRRLRRAVTGALLVVPFAVAGVVATATSASGSGYHDVATDAGATSISPTLCAHCHQDLSHVVTL
jgi:hypothetical protein